jgi:lipopolysaccharide transport system permease protein
MSTPRLRDLKEADSFVESPLEPASRSHITIIEPFSTSGLPNVKEIWQYKDLLSTLALRDVKLRYRQTALGAIWVVFQPLVTAVIFTIVFTRIAEIKTPIPYFAFAFAGSIAYSSFTATLNKASMSLVQHSQMVSKVFFPRAILPLSTMYGSLIDLGVSLIIMVGILLFYKIPLTFAILTLPLWIVSIQCLALGIGLCCAAIVVSYRDVQFALPVLIQLGTYITPVGFSLAYALGKLSSKGFLLMLNPMSGLIDGFRWAVLGLPVYSVPYVFVCLLSSLVIFFLGWKYFISQEAKFADVI